jgi:hypothetical protein
MIFDRFIFGGNSFFFGLTAKYKDKVAQKPLTENTAFLRKTTVTVPPAYCSCLRLCRRYICS